jgi:DNA-binding PadR family transcriptional regulator
MKPELDAHDLALVYDVWSDFDFPWAPATTAGHRTATKLQRLGLTEKTDRIPCVYRLTDKGQRLLLVLQMFQQPTQER